MDENGQQDKGKKTGKGGVPLWFKLFALILPGLLIAKLLGVQVFIEITYDGDPFLAALTDVRIYFVPLFLILLYILLTWLWKKLLGPGDSD